MVDRLLGCGDRKVPASETNALLSFEGIGPRGFGLELDL
jgi:hypothetical protein